MTSRRRSVARHASPGARQWLLLIHQIPPKPDYLRVKIGRRLQRVGAVPVKNSVYVLPDNEQSFEDFQWVRTEIIDGGGDASICRVDFVDGLTDEQIRHLFQSARDAEYAAIGAEARALLASIRGKGRRAGREPPARVDEDVARLSKRLASVDAIDFFDSSARPGAHEAVKNLRAALEPVSVDTSAGKGQVDRARYRGRTWVTRLDVYVDRIASAWLIRRFIDRDARFRFVRPETVRATAREIRFDMFDAEFTHDGDRCTFETLLSRFALDDLALQRIAEVVHDIDLKDAKFGRDETAGVERMLTGIVAGHEDDATRLERGALVFDALYAAFNRPHPSSAARRRAP